MRSDQILYLSHQEVAAVGPSMAEIIDALEVAFREKGEGRVEMPPKPGIHPRNADNFIHAMPAWIPALDAAGIKWVSGFPGNPERHLPYITGLLILNDPDTGLPIAVMDCEWITAMRTGAATALAARYLAREDSATVGILACGVQGRVNLEALRVLFPLSIAKVYDVDEAAAQRFAVEIESTPGIAAEVVEEPRAAVAGCDIVVTSGPIFRRPHATIQADWLDRGAFASLVDFDSYWHPQAMSQVDLFCTDDLEQFLYYRRAGYFQQTPEIHADLGELVTGRKPGRSNPSERTMAVNLGLALDDMAVAPLIYRQALELERGTWLAR